MSNKRKLPRQVPPGVAATARAARCSDCPGRAQARWSGGAWVTTLHHAPGCPSWKGITPGLHADAAATVARAAAETGTALEYKHSGDEGFVIDHGVVTATGSGRPW